MFTTGTGEPCNPRNAVRALEVAATQAGIPHAGLHTLRHSAASVMLTSGVPLEVVSEILGHSSIAITGDVHGTSRPRPPAAPWTSSAPPSASEVT
ncbi:tyrosine-type recombinase/integrase [Modestobacter sp. I12A-02662]|uniref:tyrosine-type recombinase/integrase n=1 Tax=Modestobacter sp. I12A-02662 TaxID=1730496 RepID=UPI0034DE5173